MRAAVLGSGSWGTTFGKVLADAGTGAVLWSRRPEVAEAVRDRHENPDYLPGVVLPDGLTATADCAEALDGADLVVLAMPSQTLRANLAAMPIGAGALVVSLAKGIELGTTKRMSEVVAEVLGVDAIVVSGPNLAHEIAAGQPTATVVAAADHDRAAAVQAAVTTAYFRPYTNTDVVGVEIGGAVKNVIALACGIAAGRKYGENAKAALITRGLAEMTRLSIVKGGRPETSMGLAGVGDLVLTCGGLQSRNFSLGFALGEGRELEEMLPRKTHGLTEGVLTADSLYELSIKLGVTMPLCHTVYRILKGQQTVEEGIEQLLARPFAEEGVSRMA